MVRAGLEGRREQPLPRPGEGDGDVELAARLRMAATRMSRRLRREARAATTPSQLSALSTIERLGPLTLGDLAGHERVQPPTMTRIVANLEEAGLVVREVDAKDRRVTRAQLTPEGRRVLQRSRTRKNAYLAKRIRLLSEADRQVLEDAVAVLEDLIEEAR